MLNNTHSTIYPDDAAAAYAAKRIAFWQERAARPDRTQKLLHRTYKKYLHKLYRFSLPENLRVLEIGCADADFLAALRPSFGVGVDFSSRMLDLARANHPELHYICCDAHLLDKQVAPELLAEPFDAIILSDFANEAWDMLAVLNNLKQFCAPHTRIIMNFHSHLWEHAFNVLHKLGAVNPHLTQNWFTPDDMAGLLNLSGFKVVRAFDNYLCPFPIPVIGSFCNRFLAKLWPFSMLNILHMQIARLAPEAPVRPSVSVVIPARNEAGNIEAALQRTPELGRGTEIIFVEGNSTDNTWDVIQEMAQKYSHRKIKTLRQPGKGKGDAVRVGFDAADGDVLMILDADLTMPPETLPQFYETIASGRAEFVNGVRLVYPQEKEAMRFFNLLGNKFFSLAFSWLLGRPIKDTLCGTKVLSRENYKKNRRQPGLFRRI